jgi:gentisate 1,2-dioxygenase
MKTTETPGAQTPLDHDAALEQLHADMAKGNALPTWVYVSKLVTREPVAGYRPYLWKWELFHRFLMRAGELVTPERGSERRSMEHLNPDLVSVSSTSHTIGTAFQLVQPGELAPAHRHTAAAIRFVVQGGGGEVFTTVQGEKLLMEENDLVLTPRWCWHDHANETSRAIIWLDALDYPLVNLLRTSFFEPYPEERQPITKPVHYTAQRVGLARPATPYPEAVPLVRYAWADTAPILESLRGSEGSPYDGLLLEYVNPFTSGPTLPTLGCSVQMLRPGEHTHSHRATTSTVYLVTRGQGYTVIGGQRFDWAKGDVFVVPPWTWHEHANQAAGDSLLFSVTDRPVLDAFGHYREEALAANDGHQEITSVFEPLTRV